jgi:hypothetical protein
MKKIIITMALVIATSFVSAQTYLKSIPEKGVKVYCELFIRSVLTFSDDIYYAEVDFGQRSNNQINNKNTLPTSMDIFANQHLFPRLISQTPEKTSRMAAPWLHLKTPMPINTLTTTATMGCT